jgi:hypothetical protein
MAGFRRNYKTDGWPTTLMLVNAIAFLSEAAYHHPDLAVTWGRVTVKLSTHSAGGITDKDFLPGATNRAGGIVATDRRQPARHWHAEQMGQKRGPEVSGRSGRSGKSGRRESRA